MLNLRLLWQAPAFTVIVAAIMSAQDPFRAALAALLFALADPARRLVLELAPASPSVTER